MSQAAGAPQISVACSCGKTLKVPGQYAGKKVKCPGCQNSLVVPSAGAAPKAAATGGAQRPAAAAQPAVVNKALTALLDEAGITGSKTGKQCPSCRGDMRMEAIICITCGYNIETGKKLKVVKKRSG